MDYANVYIARSNATESIANKVRRRAPWHGLHKRLRSYFNKRLRSPNACVVHGRKFAMRLNACTQLVVWDISVQELSYPKK